MLSKEEQLFPRLIPMATATSKPWPSQLRSKVEGKLVVGAGYTNIYCAVRLCQALSWVLRQLPHQLSGGTLGRRLEARNLPPAHQGSLQLNTSGIHSYVWSRVHCVRSTFP